MNGKSSRWVQVKNNHLEPLQSLMYQGFEGCGSRWFKIKDKFLIYLIFFSEIYYIYLKNIKYIDNHLEPLESIVLKPAYCKGLKRFKIKIHLEPILNLS